MNNCCGFNNTSAILAIVSFLSCCRSQEFTVVVAADSKRHQSQRAEEVIIHTSSHIAGHSLT